MLEGEIAALESIFGDDLIVERHTATGSDIWGQLILSLGLLPAATNSSSCSGPELYLCISRSYPERSPMIMVRRCPFGSIIPADIRPLTAMCKRTARSMAGAEMIFDLIVSALMDLANAGGESLPLVPPIMPAAATLHSSFFLLPCPLIPGSLCP